jgi:hypothetical protein
MLKKVLLTCLILPLTLNEKDIWIINIKLKTEDE